MICLVNPHAQRSLSVNPESVRDLHSRHLQKSLALPPVQSAIMKAVQVSLKQRWYSVFVIFLTLRPATCSSVNKFFLTRQLLDKRSASNFCIKDGLTTSILLKNGIELRFSYKTSEQEKSPETRMDSGLFHYFLSSGSFPPRINIASPKLKNRYFCSTATL